MSTSILTLVTFLPTIGAILLMLMPRNDRALRMMALVTSIVTFAFSLTCHFIMKAVTRAFSLIPIMPGSARPSTTTWQPTASPCGWSCSPRSWFQ